MDGHGITIKKFFAATSESMGCEDGDLLWHYLEGWCMKELREIDEDAAYAALVFDGDGGLILGVDQCEPEEENKDGGS